MPFPDVKRVIFKKNPLVEVVCQLRFPTQLKLKKGIPLEFQDQIKKRFSLVEEVETLGLQVTDKSSAPEQVKIRFYNFLTEDRSSKIVLSPDSITMATENYIDWDRYKADARLAFTAFRDLYQPLHFTRLGLRYKNVIRPSLIPDKSLAIAECLRPSLLGVLPETPEIIRNLIDYTAQFKMEVKEAKAMLHAQYGYIWNTESDEQGFLLDADYFTRPDYQMKELEDVFTKMDDFKRRSHNFFRWSISRGFEEAMGRA